MSTNLYIYKKGFEKYKEEAENNEMDETSYDFTENYASKECCSVDVKFEEVYWDKSENALYASIVINKDGESIAYFSTQIPVGLDDARQILEMYMKKLGQLKSVMEIANAQ